MSKTLEQAVLKAEKSTATRHAKNTHEAFFQPIVDDAVKNGMTMKQFAKQLSALIKDAQLAEKKKGSGDVSDGIAIFQQWVFERKQKKGIKHSEATDQWKLHKNSLSPEEKSRLAEAFHARRKDKVKVSKSSKKINMAHVRTAFKQKFRSDNKGSSDKDANAAWKEAKDSLTDEQISEYIDAYKAFKKEQEEQEEKKKAKKKAEEAKEVEDSDNEEIVINSDNEEV